MKFRTSIPMMTAALLFAPAAFAQDAATQTAPAPAAAPATDAAATPVTDAEVSQFATAALAIQKVQTDTAIPAADKNTKMAEAVTASGLDPVRFNAISQAMQADPALNKKIQEAAAAQQKAAPAPAGR